MNSAETKYLKIDFDEALALLKRYARKRGAAFRARTIVLTGSLARGDYTGTSDADILIIADDLPRNPLERYLQFAEPSLPFDIEPRAYTPREFGSMVKQRDVFAIQALRVGIPLYGRKYFEHLLKFARQYAFEKSSSRHLGGSVAWLRHGKGRLKEGLNMNGR